MLNKLSTFLGRFAMKQKVYIKGYWVSHIQQLFFEIEVNSGWICEVNIPKATIHRDWKE